MYTSCLANSLPVYHALPPFQTLYPRSSVQFSRFSRLLPQIAGNQRQIGKIRTCNGDSGLHTRCLANSLPVYHALPPFQTLYPRSSVQFSRFSRLLPQIAGYQRQIGKIRTCNGDSGMYTSCLANSLPVYHALPPFQTLYPHPSVQFSRFCRLLPQIAGNQRQIGH
jgi:hypothetical protein